MIKNTLRTFVLTAAVAIGGVAATAPDGKCRKTPC